MKVHGRIICYPESRSDCQELTNAAESYFTQKARSSQAVETDNKYKVTITFDDIGVEDDFDPYDLAKFLWLAIEEYCWVGVFFKGDATFEERFSYDDYEECDE